MNTAVQLAGTKSDWHPGSWRDRHALQQPHYDDPKLLSQVLDDLSTRPPLVTSQEVLSLKKDIAEAQDGKRFLLQGGDCAERFDESTDTIITNRLKVLLQMSLVLVHGLQKPVIQVGRFAGQYAKPRSSDYEARGEMCLPAFRGDLVNSIEFTPEGRRADPKRMLEAYARATQSMNFTRALVNDGFTDMHHPENWNLGWTDHSPHAVEYRRMLESISTSLRFMRTLDETPHSSSSRMAFYTSHEALLLPYEQAQTRTGARNWGWFNLSAHFPWIGMRTASVDGAHVEYFRGIRNPIAVKIGASTTPDELLELLDVLNPTEEPGRIALITRMGHRKIAETLPRLLDAVRHEGRKVLWVSDPMHGNTETTRNGYKTRHFDNIRSELNQAFDIHAAAGTYLGGIHLELTGEAVTECLGGARNLVEEDLRHAYKSSVDPRLNHEQALELALLTVRKLICV